MEQKTYTSKPYYNFDNFIIDGFDLKRAGYFKTNTKSPKTGLFVLAIVLGFLFNPIIGIVIAIAGANTASKNSVYERFLNTYFPVMRTKDTWSLREIAALSGIDIRTVRSDLTVLFDTKIIRLNAKSKNRRTSEKTAAKAPTAQYSDPPEARRETALKHQLEKAAVFIQKLKQLNDEITAEEISAKIDKIERLTKDIYESAKADKESVRYINRLISYYLPTTEKLLKTYADLDKKETQSPTLLRTKSKIEESMDKIVTAFERICENINEYTDMGVTCEISALENILMSEGLIQDELGSIGGAESEYNGFDEIAD